MSKQMYCVVATVNGVRKAITGPMAKERAEAWCKMENETPAYRREAKYPKVAKFPYKSYYKRKEESNEIRCYKYNAH